MSDESTKSHGSHEASAPFGELGSAGTLSDGSQPESSASASDTRVARLSDAERVGRASQPLDESSPADSPAPSAVVPDVVSDRRADGTFAPGNTASLTHGARRSLDRPDALAAIAEKRAEIEAHLGDAASVVQQDLASDYARLDTIIESVAANLEAGGIFTAKGKTRAAVSLLLSLMDRRLRLATTLGLERKQRTVHPLDAVRAAVAEANRTYQLSPAQEGDEQ